MAGSCQNKEYNSSPVWFISKVFGLALFTTSPSKRNLYLNIAYTGAYCAVYLVFFALSVKYNPLAHKNYPVICIVGNYMHIYIAFYVCLQSYLLSLKKGSFLNQFFWRIKAVDDKLAEILEKKHDFFSDARRWQYFGVILTMALFAALAVFDFITFHRLYGRMILVICFSYIFPYFISTVVILQFISVVKLIQLRFKCINDSLNFIASNNEVTSSAVKSYKDLFETSIGNFNKMQQVLFVVNKEYGVKISSVGNHGMEVDSEEESESIHQDMQRLFELHDELLELAELANTNYSSQVVSFITSSFVIILFGLFFETKVVFWLWGQNLQLILVATSYLLWGILTAVLIFSVLMVCATTRDEAYQSAMIVHKILQMRPMFMLKDEIYYNKMKSFTLQILHRKNTFNFNGLGLFRLDYTFIFSAVSAATSYLIVLLQFDMSSDLVVD